MSESGTKVYQVEVTTTADEISETWWVLETNSDREANGRLGRTPRTDAPETIRRSRRTGVVLFELWRSSDGALSREDGPACIVRDEKTGIVTAEAWLRQNEPYRTDGPHCILRDKNTGRVQTQKWMPSVPASIRQEYNRVARRQRTAALSSSSSAAPSPIPPAQD